MTPEQLKASILQYAVQGKLVEQRKEEGSAEILYQQLQEEKQELIKDGKVKKEKPLSKITEDEIPFDIPDTWKWIKLGDIVSVYGGKRIPAGRKLTTENTGHRYIRVSDMKNGSVLTENLLYVPKDIYPSISRYVINKEDVYITVAGTIGRVGKIPPEIDGANLTENADRLVFHTINQDWLIRTLESALIQQQILDATTKVGQPKLAIHLFDVSEEKPTNGYSVKGVDYQTPVRNLTLTATTSGYFKADAFKYVDIQLESDSKYWLKKNDLLIQRSNSRELVGTSCIYSGDDNAFIYPDLMMKIRILPSVDVKYVDYVLKAPITRNYFSKSASGTSESMPKINQGIVMHTLIPLPPLAEQKRIVEKLEELLPYCDKLVKEMENGK